MHAINFYLKIAIAAVTLEKVKLTWLMEDFDYMYLHSPKKPSKSRNNTVPVKKFQMRKQGQGQTYNMQ